MSFITLHALQKYKLKYDVYKSHVAAMLPLFYYRKSETSLKRLSNKKTPKHYQHRKTNATSSNKMALLISLLRYREFYLRQPPIPAYNLICRGMQWRSHGNKNHGSYVIAIPRLTAEKNLREYVRDYPRMRSWIAVLQVARSLKSF